MQISSTSFCFAQCCTFRLKQPSFGIQSSGKSSKSAVCPNYSMTRYEYAYAVGSHSLRHSSHPFGVSDTLSYLHVAACLAIGNLKQGLPYALLKVGTNGQKRNVESPASSTEIFVKFRFCMHKYV